MAYIGKEPIVGNFQKCDAISVVNGQAAYTLQVSSTNVVPESANHMLVSLNGILQAPVTSFTVSGSTLTFASNLATGDVIDFVILLGNVLDLGTPSDNTVTTAKIADDAVTAAKIADAVSMGKIGQVVSTTKTDTFSASGDLGFDDVTGLSASITPSATSSKILVLWNIEIGHSATSNGMLTRLMRGTTAISIGDAASNRQRSLTGQTTAYSNTTNTTRGKAGSFLDSPSSTSSTTYKLQVQSDAGTIYVNREGSYDDNSYCGTGTSTITVMEVLA